MTREPRLLTKAEAAHYTGCGSLRTFEDRVQRGILPGPVPGTHSWDRKAIDLWLDRKAGIATTIAPADDASAALAEWRAKRARAS